MYLAILVKTDGRVSGFVSDDDRNLGISFQSQKIATNLFAIYIFIPTKNFLATI